MKKSELMEVANWMVSYFQHFGNLPPGAISTIYGLAEKHPVQYMMFINQVMSINPAVVAALKRAEHPGDDGPESDGGPVPPGMHLDIKTDKRVPIEGEYMKEYQ